MHETSLFAIALIALIGVAWWSNDLERLVFVTPGQRWLRRLARLVMLVLAVLVMGGAAELGQRRGDDPSGPDVDLNHPY